VTVENLTAGTINKAKMLNFSATGLYFEADNLMQPGEEVFVGIDNSPFASEQGLYECYRVEIVWRKELKKSVYYYGYGAQHTIDHHQVNLEEGETKEWKDIRRHQRKTYTKSVQFAADDRIFNGLIKNISSAGGFIEVDANISAGQSITFVLPLKKGQRAVVRGEVIWSGPDGFGLKFLSIDKPESA
jgi:Tfp pilus assembly protein PilZ